MGLAYFRLEAVELNRLMPLIVQHESDMLGPRARGFWFDRPDEYDYQGVQSLARQLYQAGTEHAGERLELTENEAHSLSLLEIEMPADGLDFPPSLFMVSALPEAVRRHLKIAQRKLGSTPEEAVERISISASDPRFEGYLQKQVRQLRLALPKVWHFYGAAAEARQGILVVDLRARDVEIPDEFELTAG